MEPPAEEVRADERDARADEEGQGGVEAREDQHLSQERGGPPWQAQVVQWRDSSTLFSVSYRYLKDFFTSMIELSWSWTLFSFAASFFISWLGFAVAWYFSSYLLFISSFCFQTRYIVVLTHGDLRDDLEDDHVVRIRTHLFLLKYKETCKVFSQMCVDNIKPDDAFTSCFLYSLETQHTIG